MESEKRSEEQQNKFDSTKLLIDSQKEIKKSNRLKDKIIIMLIVFLFVEPIILFSGFLLYESQFEYVDLCDTAEETSVDLDASGDGANAEYNDVEGDQYNDSSHIMKVVLNNGKGERSCEKNKDNKSC